MELILSGLLFLSIGIVGGYFLTRSTTGFWNHKWHTVTGRITENNARTYIEIDESETEPDSYPSHELAYEYVVNGTPYTSNTIAVNSYPYEYEEIEKLYPVGKITQVFYNPKNIEKSCLKTRDIGDSIGNIVVMSVFALVGIGIITAGIYK